MNIPNQNSIRKDSSRIDYKPLLTGKAKSHLLSWPAGLTSGFVLE